MYHTQTRQPVCSVSLCKRFSHDNTSGGATLKLVVLKHSHTIDQRVSTIEHCNPPPPVVR